MKSIAREFVVALVCLLLAAGVTLADKKPTKKPEDVKKPDGDKKPTKKPDDKKPDDKKPEADKKPAVIVLQLDVSKLPPDLLKQILAAAGADKKPTEKKPDEDKKPTKKPEDDKKPDEAKKRLNLAGAIAIAEKHVSGIAIKAEYDGDHFEVEVKTSKGTVKVKLDHSGNVADGKGKGKKKSDD